MPEPQVDALVRAPEIKNFPSVCGVNPTPIGFFHWDGVVSPLDSPALHQEFLLYSAEIFSVFCCFVRCTFGSIR
jgi:hypothetical protein